MGQINLKQTDTPQTPATGRVGIFIALDGQPKAVNDAGTQSPLAGIADAASDGKVRGRKDGTWVESQPLNKDPYANQAAMLADQAAQIPGFLYNDGTSTWAKLAATTGFIADYVKVGDVAAAALVENYTPKSGTVVTFEAAYKHGYNGTPETGNITIGITGAKEINMIKMLHNSGTIPSITPPGGVTMHRSGGEYTVSIDNELLFICHLNDAGVCTRVSYTISPKLT